MKITNKILAAAFVLISSISFAQCDTIASICGIHITDGFISDGQIYRSLLIDDQIAEFHTTFMATQNTVSQLVAEQQMETYSLECLMMKEI